MDWYTDEIAATFLVKWNCLCANIAHMQILCSSGFKVQEGSITMNLCTVVYLLHFMHKDGVFYLLYSFCKGDNFNYVFI